MVKLTARRQVKHLFNTEDFVNNLNLMAGTDKRAIAYSDTLAYLMKHLNSEELSAVRIKMISRLLRMRCLEKYRLLDKYYMIAIDMTGHIYFGKKRHCQRCLTQEKNGVTYYYHAAVEAKFITTGGLWHYQWRRNPLRTKKDTINRTVS